ncbi:DUF3820 family protein [bacterium]|nr:DUF3820 family protein [bacterium]
MTMPWGRYRGQDIADVPLGYLTWLLDEGRALRPDLRRAVCAEVADRLDLRPEPPAPRRPLPPPALASAIRDIIAAGYRAVALRAHPDRGGTHQAMVAATEARDWLREQVAL